MNKYFKSIILDSDTIAEHIDLVPLLLELLIFLDILLVIELMFPKWAGITLSLMIVFVIEALECMCVGITFLYF